MKAIDRNYGILDSNKPDLVLLDTISNMPIKCSVANLTTKSSDDIFLDFNVCADRNTGLIQVNPLVPTNLLYETPHNDSLGAVWKAHHQEFCQFLMNNCNPKTVLEFGGGSGVLSKLYLDRFKSIDWTVCDINTSMMEGRTDITTISGDVNDIDSSIFSGCDVVVSSHFLEHLYNPGEFIRSVSENTREGMIHIFSIPNFRNWLSAGHSNCIFFEHTLYLDEHFIKILLEANGFVLTDLHYFNDHSIFFSCKNVKKYTNVKIVSRYEEMKMLYSSYLHKLNTFIADINASVDSNDDVFIFGAHIFSQVLLVKGLSETIKVNGILDNSPIKIRKRLYGFDYEVYHPSIIKNYKNPVVVLWTGAYQKEIKNDLCSINSNVRVLDGE
jgi:hypothetical protein